MKSSWSVRGVTRSKPFRVIGMWVSVVPMVTLAFLGGGGGSTVHAQERFFSAFAAGDVKDQEQALHPSADGLWYDLDETTQFQPAPLLRHRDLQQSDGSSSYAQSSLFQDSLDTYYDPYQTAWRYLGFYVDCSPFDTTYDSQDYRQRVRHLEQNNNNNKNNNNNNNNNGGVNYQQQHRCRRYLLWAAYVDLDYQGGGIGEYQIYDVYQRKWDQTACQTRSNSRCAKMDCHEPGTNWKLLGFYKELGYTRWFEQLFKHQGFCIWNNYKLSKFMYTHWNAWPRTCTQTSQALSDGSYLYYEMKPIEDGNMTIALYTDWRCAEEYTGSDYTVQSVLSSKALSGRNYNYNNGYEWNAGVLLGSYQNAWNDAMSIYKVCQPCRAYNLQMTSQSWQNNNNYQNWASTDDYYDPDSDGDNNRRLQSSYVIPEDESEQRRQLNNNNGNYYGPNNGYFRCYDPAGYTDVNQCMKFRTKTFMEPASAYEVITAAQQGSLLQTEVRGVVYGGRMPVGLFQETERETLREDRILATWAFLIFATGVGTLVGVAYWIRDRRRRDQLKYGDLKQSLL